MKLKQLEQELSLTKAENMRLSEVSSYRSTASHQCAFCALNQEYSKLKFVRDALTKTVDSFTGQIEAISNEKDSLKEERDKLKHAADLRYNVQLRKERKKQGCDKLKQQVMFL